MDISMRDICEHLLVKKEKDWNKNDVWYKCLICGGVFEERPTDSLLICIDKILEKEQKKEKTNGR